MRLVLLALLGLLAVATARDIYYRYPFLEGKLCHNYAHFPKGEVYYREHRASSSYFKLACPVQDRRLCDWYHEGWKIPRLYMRDITIDDRGTLRMRALTDNSGTWRVRFGDRWIVYHITVMPEKYEDFHEDFREIVDGVKRYSYDNRKFEDRNFEDKYFYNRLVKNSYFKRVRFVNMHFHYVRFENVTFKDVRFEWSKELDIRAEFINCRFINTMWLRPRFKHCYFHRCRFEGGMRFDRAELRYREYLHTFIDFRFYDTIFCRVDWFDTFWHRGEMYDVTFNDNRWERFELFETRFYSYYRMRVACRDIRYRDYVKDFRYFDDDHCYAYVYRYGVDREFNFDDKLDYRDDKFNDRDDYRSWHPSVKFYNCRFDFFRFRRHRFRAVEWFSTYFYNGTFYGEDRDYGYFKDMHFAKCHFYHTDFYRHYFHGFIYFTGCYFDRFDFRETYGDRIDFHGCEFRNFKINFRSCRFMHFDYCLLEYGYIRGRYDFFRFERMLHRYIRWEVERVEKFEFCKCYFDNLKIVDVNIGSYKRICDNDRRRERERLDRFCYDHPYYHRCLHYRPYDRFYCCRDERHRCDLRDYDLPFFEKCDKDKYDCDKDRCDRRDDKFDTRKCYRRMDKFYDEPELVMREIDFELKRGDFLGLDYNHRHYYDGVRKLDEFYYKICRAIDRRYNWFERYIRCLRY